MRILLIHSLAQKMFRPYFPLGLAYIAGSLLREGYDITIWDMNAEDCSSKDAFTRINDTLRSYDLIGISALTGDYQYVKWTSGLLRKMHPGIKIVLGGLLASTLPLFLMEHLPIDFVVAGEGEETIVELVDAVSNGADLNQVKGIYFKDSSGNIVSTPSRPRLKTLENLPIPPWELFPVKTYFENPYHSLEKRSDRVENSKEAIMPIMASRGCPYDCIYCDHTIKGYIHRYRPVKSVINEIRLILSKYGEKVNSIYFWDDIFIWDRDWVTNFCETLLSENLKIRWTCNCHAKKVEPRLMSLMKKAGCVNVRFGVESGSQRILDSLNKKVKVEESLEALNISLDAGLTITIYIMVGMTGENHETINETIDFFRKLINPFNVYQIRKIHFFMLTPFPGTKLYENAKKDGFINNDAEFLKKGCDAQYDIPLNISGQTDQDLLKLQKLLEDEVHLIIQEKADRFNNLLLNVRRDLRH